MNEAIRRKLQKQLHRVTEEVLEKLAFIFSFPATDRGVPSGNNGFLNREISVTSMVPFSGPFDGAIAVVVSRESLPELAGNMLGVDVSATGPTEQNDALKELANVICGNLLPVIADKRTIFNVGAPEITDKPFAQPPVAATKMSLEKGECDIYLFIQDELPETVSAEIMAAETADDDTPDASKADEEDWSRFSSDDLESF